MSSNVPAVRTRLTLVIASKGDADLWWAARRVDARMREEGQRSADERGLVPHTGQLRYTVWWYADVVLFLVTVCEVVQEEFPKITFEIECTGGGIEFLPPPSEVDYDDPANVVELLEKLPDEEA